MISFEGCTRKDAARVYKSSAHWHYGAKSCRVKQFALDRTCMGWRHMIIENGDLWLGIMVSWSIR